jgi:hypothetical protein
MSRTTRRWLVALLAVGVIAALLFVIVLGIMLTIGDPGFGSNPFFAEMRQSIREIWASMTGQSVNDDLFP